MQDRSAFLIEQASTVIELEKVKVYFCILNSKTYNIDLPLPMEETFSVRTALKSSDNKRPFEKGTEVEESFGRNSLSFRVDKMTLQQRKIIMERQKNIADENMVNEINCFSNMLKVCAGYFYWRR